jgi:hypothetical protein
LAYTSTLKMETACFPETSVDFQRTTWRYVPEVRTFQTLTLISGIGYFYLTFTASYTCNCSVHGPAAFLSQIQCLMMCECCSKESPCTLRHLSHRFTSPWKPAV